MATLHKFDGGGYAFLEGGFPYSAGVVAELHTPLPLAPLLVLGTYWPAQWAIAMSVAPRGPDGSMHGGRSR